VRGGFNIDPVDAEARITPRTRALIAVHIAGESCDLDRLRGIAVRHNLSFIEDAAHALPAMYKGERIGHRSELGAFSFYATKTITTGEGGMLTTNNDDIAHRASLMRLHGISGDAWKRYMSEGSWYYEVVEPGFKMNMPDLLAALGRAQLRKCDEFHRRRCEIAAQYLHSLREMDELELPAVARHTDHAWHLFILRLRPEHLGLNRNEFVRNLKAAGIGTSVHFIPLHLHPYYQQQYGYQPGEFPRAEDAYSRAISLPIFPAMRVDEVERVIAAVKHEVINSRKTMLAGAA
jgi:perosamine synthetase